MQTILETNSETVVPQPAHSVFRGGLAWVIWASSAIFVLFQFFLQLSSGEIVDGLMQSFKLTAFGGGFLASTYYYVYVALQTPAGILTDRFGPRYLLTVGSCIAALGCLIFGASHHLLFAILGRLMMGSGCAFAFVGSLNLISKWFPPQRFGLMASMAETIGALGSTIGGFLLAALVVHFGWRNCMLGASIIATLIALMIWILVRDNPSEHHVIHTRPAKGDLLRDLSLLLSNKVTWVNAIYSGLMFSIITVFAALWAVPFFQVEHHLSLMQSACTCAFVFLGLAISSPLAGWLDARFPIRHYLCVAAPIVAALILGLIIFVPTLSMVEVLILLFFLGAASSGYVLTFVIGNEIASPRTKSTSIGFVNTISVGTAPILQPLVGLVLFLQKNHSSVMHYTLKEFQFAFLGLIILLLIGSVLGFYLPTSKMHQKLPS